MSSAAQLIRREAAFSMSRAYAQLFKVRVTMLVVITAWCGAYFAATRSGTSPVSLIILKAMVGIALVAAGSFGLNEVIERDGDARMRRTSMRPLVTGAVTVFHATAVSGTAVLTGIAYLAFSCNWMTAVLTLLTSAAYLGAYTPMKSVGPSCTFIGAFPGAMPPLLGWVATRGRVEWEALVLFAIVFLWQFPHFHSIGLLYQDDYGRAGIRMLPVVDTTGRATARAIVLYSLALIPATLMPALLRISGWFYGAIALMMALLLLGFGVRIWRAPPNQPQEIQRAARQLLQATVLFLPALLALMVLDRR